MRISDWSSDVCSSDLAFARCSILFRTKPQRITQKSFALSLSKGRSSFFRRRKKGQCFDKLSTNGLNKPHFVASRRSEEHTSELQSLMRISYAVFCLKKKTHRHMNTLRTTIYHNRA